LLFIGKKLTICPHKTPSMATPVLWCRYMGLVLLHFPMNQSHVRDNIVSIDYRNSQYVLCPRRFDCVLVAKKLAFMGI